MTEKYGTPFRFCLLKIAGAPPRSAKAVMARLVVYTAALPVEKTERRTRAFTKDGKTGICSRFMADVSSRLI